MPRSCYGRRPALTSGGVRFLLIFLAFAAACLTSPDTATAVLQKPEESGACVPFPDAGLPEWDASRVRSIVREAVLERQHAFSDTVLRAFDAYAEGHVDFLADFGELGGEQTVRSDRIALKLQWLRDTGSLQTFIGRRRVSWAPTRIRYHVDHLSLVMENFGRTIEVGEGDEVKDVLHPIAPGAPEYYQYRLVDSLAIMVGQRTSMVYRIQVRPGCQNSPGVVGTLDIDFETLAIARMSTTFTPSSYVDPTVAGVNLVLENGWVERRWWLPVQQRIEVRRQVRWMDLPFASTIRTGFRILDYDLDPPPHYGMRKGHRVVSLPRVEIERYAGWQAEEMQIRQDGAPDESTRFERIRREATSIAGGRYLSGNARLRFFLPDVSSGLRYRRAEGLLLGAGLSYHPGGSTGIYGWGSYPFEHRTPEWALEFRQGVGESTVRLEAYLERHTDIGPFSAASGVISSLGAALGGDDYVDPYFQDGAALSVTGPVRSWLGTARIIGEDHQSARLVAGAAGDTEPRPVHPITEGTDIRLDLELEKRLGTAAAAAWSLVLTAQIAGGGDFDYTRWIASLEAGPPDPEAAWQWEAVAAAGIATGTTPEQRLFLLGGRGTVPGHDFRPWGGDRAAFALAAVSREVAAPWLRIRVLAAAGWTDLTDVGRVAAARMGVTESAGLRPSLGAGLSLLWDLLRVDAAHGLDDGEWEWMLSVNPAWRAPL